MDEFDQVADDLMGHHFTDHPENTVSLSEQGQLQRGIAQAIRNRGQ